MELSEAHGLPAGGGGLYEESAARVGGDAMSCLGGMSVPPRF